MNKTKLQSAISSFIKNKKANAVYYTENWRECKERKAMPPFRQLSPLQMKNNLRKSFAKVRVLLMNNPSALGIIKMNV